MIAATFPPYIEAMQWFFSPLKVIKSRKQILNQKNERKY